MKHPISLFLLLLSLVIISYFSFQLGILYLASQVKNSFETPPSISPKTNFAVVDTYKGCDVVQWSDNQMATYKYFLDCTDSMRNK